MKLSEEETVEEVEETGTNPLLDAVLDELGSENIVAFLGPPNSGKTVIATLLKDAIYSHFLEKNKDYEVNMTTGYEFLKVSTDMMLDGKFPSTTMPNTEGEVIFKIQRKGPLTRGVSLRIRDMSGEDYESLCVGGDIDRYDRVESVLRRGKTRRMKYGPLSFIVVASMYIIMIDCALFKKWKKYELDYSHLVNNLLDFQNVATDEEGEQIVAPIAVILTKADCIPEEYASIPSQELIAKSMPQFDKTLKMLHNKEIEYFKLSIDTARNPDNEKIDSQIKVPWSYSNEEYERILLWIIKNIA